MSVNQCKKYMCTCQDLNPGERGFIARPFPFPCPTGPKFSIIKLSIIAKSIYLRDTRHYRVTSVVAN